MTASLAFAPAVRTQRKLRMAIEGPSGSGKTLSALKVAHGIANGGKVALIDTEHASGSIYANDPNCGNLKYDTLCLDEFKPELYIEALKLAAQSGYTIVIIDSLSHAWEGKGGVLDRVNSRGGNSFVEWGKVGTPLQVALIETIVSSPLHVIATLRVKSEYVIEKDERTGKSVPRRVGLAAVQRQGTEYEFDVVGVMNLEHRMTIEKTRMSTLAGSVIDRPDDNLGKTILEWLNGGEPAPVAQPKPSLTPDDPERESILEALKSLSTTYKDDIVKAIALLHGEGSKASDCTTDQLRAIFQVIKDKDEAKQQLEQTADSEKKPEGPSKELLLKHIQADVTEHPEHRDWVIQQVKHLAGTDKKTKDCTVEQLQSIIQALNAVNEAEANLNQEIEEPKPEPTSATTGPSIEEKRAAMRRLPKPKRDLMSQWLKEHRPDFQHLKDLTDDEVQDCHAHVFTEPSTPESNVPEDEGSFD